jgi:protocatechuate 3,4-dioxygenase beta subunit
MIDCCLKRKATHRLLNRRDLLRLMGTAGFAAMIGCRHRRRRPLETPSSADMPPSAASAGETPVCVVRPAQTEGPYFIDEKLNRSDIRSDPSDHSTKPGLPLRLAFHVSRIDGRSCSPINGAVVDVWHCDALGVYSDGRDPSFATKGQKFLRGYQTTDTNGVAEFLTIYPGWYAGRAVHIHFKIRTSPIAGRSYEFTSQLYFDESVTDEVHAQAPYASKGRRSTPNDKDSLFREGGKQLMPVLTKNTQGYATKFEIALQKV